MRITPAQYAAALYEALWQVGPQDQDAVLDRFAQMLAGRGHSHLLDKIEAAYYAYEREKKGIVSATVTLAQSHSVDGKIMAELNRIFGGQMEVRKQLDASKLGGILAETEDTRIDASLRKKLQQLKHSLSS